MIHPPAAALTDADKAELRAVLTARLAELQELDDLSGESRKPVELDQQSVGRLSRVDAMQQQAMAFASQGRRQHDIRLITQALIRLETDDYGWCGACGEAIALARLRLDPTLAQCVDCAGARQ
ncbi:MAG: TraR/DksA family transcriptional regulator [Brevundimonas sp.]